jgi:hypothetical protein
LFDLLEEAAKKSPEDWAQEEGTGRVGKDGEGIQKSEGSEI